jgi:asparagine synthase (glutamine-hydrolysing)
VLADGEREPRIEAYWSARSASEQARANPFAGSRDEAVAALEQVLKQSIKGQMMADVPLGAFLSGGIDSSTVVALMQSMSSQPVRTFTIGFHQAGYNEAEHAKQVARHLGTDHTELYVTEREAMDVIPGLPQIYCEPFSDSSQIPTYLVSKLARQNVTVSLSGDGGDELFSGYTRYSIADEFWKKLSRVPHPLRRATAGLATLPSPAFYDGLAGPLMSLLPERRRFGRVGDRVHKAARLLAMPSPDDLYLHLCSHWTDPASIVSGSREPPTMLTGLDALPDLPGNVERMMYLDLLSYLPDDILVKVDRAAMAVSLETRVPMLDHRVVEFAMSLPLPILRSQGRTKWPLRQLLYKFVPSELVERPKMGFGVPIDSWLRGALRDWAEDLLSEARLKADDFFDPAPIRLAWQDHLSGRRNHQYPLWNVLMFQAWRVAQKDVRSALAA